MLSNVWGDWQAWSCIVLSTFIQTVKKGDAKAIAVQGIIISTTPSTLARFSKASLHVNIKRICGT